MNNSASMNYQGYSDCSGESAFLRELYDLAGNSIQRIDSFSDSKSVFSSDSDCNLDKRSADSRNCRVNRFKCFSEIIKPFSQTCVLGTSFRKIREFENLDDFRNRSSLIENKEKDPNMHKSGEILFQAVHNDVNISIPNLSSSASPQKTNNRTENMPPNTNANMIKACKIMKQGRSTDSISSFNSSRSNSVNYNCQMKVINAASILKRIRAKFDKVHLRWNEEIRTVLIVTKIYDTESVEKCRDAVCWLLKLGIRVFLEDVLFSHENFCPDRVENVALEQQYSRHFSEPLIIKWNNESYPGNEINIDVIITFGGDGTVLHAGWLFNTFCPPIISYDLGTLGFLAMFPFDSFLTTISKLLGIGRNSIYDRLLKEQEDSTKVVSRVKKGGYADKCNVRKYTEPKGSYRITFRERLACIICRKDEFERISNDIVSRKGCENRKIMPNLKCVSSGFNFDPLLLKEKQVNVLNDLVLDRGPTSYMCEIEIYVNEVFLTLLRSDGVVVSTSTGSTAYSLSAGGPLLHPSLSCITITPICPHTVSFRPITFPATVTIRLTVPQLARACAWASFDGKSRACINKGDSVIVCASDHPLPTVSRFGVTEDWFGKIENCLGWKRYYPKEYENI